MVLRGRVDGWTGGRDGAELGAEGRNYHISGCSGVPPFGTDTKTPQSHRSSQRAFPSAQSRVDFYLTVAAVSPADGSIAVLIYC